MSPVLYKCRICTVSWFKRRPVVCKLVGRNGQMYKSLLSREHLSAFNPVLSASSTQEDSMEVSVMKMSVSGQFSKNSALMSPCIQYTTRQSFSLPLGARNQSMLSCNWSLLYSVEHLTQALQYNTADLQLLFIKHHTGLKSTFQAHLLTRKNT